MTGSEARRENNVNLDFPRLAGQSGPVPGPMGLHNGGRLCEAHVLLLYGGDRADCLASG